MTGSGTCLDVCKELKIPCDSFDVRKGFDAADQSFYPEEARYDFIWIHPPYWKMKHYSDDSRCLSNAPDMQAFYHQMRRVIRNCKSILTEKGKIAILMGDYHDSKLGKMVPCTQMTREAALQEGLWPACTEIIRFQHGNSSSVKFYNSSFIPGLHDTCMIFEKSR